MLDGQAKSFLVTENGVLFGIIDRGDIIRGVKEFDSNPACSANRSKRTYLR